MLSLLLFALWQEAAGVSPLEAAERYRVAGLEDRRFDQEKLWSVLAPFLSSPQVRVEEIGRSIQNRAIRAFHLGEGPTGVLLWSQMHGDESTATMASADVLRFLAAAEGDPMRERIVSRLTVSFVLVLNPDGAAAFQRRNAIGVDVNRDARRLATPEARALKEIRDRIEPQFGFNLHDQNARILAGEGGEQVALALLAPAADEERSWGEVRSRARLVAAAIASALEREVPGRIAKYDDTFNPRAFGDLMQLWGTSTVLIESGALEDDPQKQKLRRLNVLAILTALDAIATGAYRGGNPAPYENLPRNESIDHDLVLRGGRLAFGDGEPFAVDVGIWFSDPVARQGVHLGEVGDLSETPAVEVLDVTGLVVEVETFDEEGAATERLLHDGRAVVTVRRPPERTGEIVHRFGER